MPKVHFVHENLTVEVDKGRRLSDIAKERGIAVCRQTLGWTGVGDYSVWVEGEDDSVSAPTLWERLRGMRGWRRLANRVRVHGDVRVWTQQGLGGRLGGARAIDAAPNPTADAEAERHPNDESGTAWCPFGHPSAIGKGTRQPPKFDADAKKGKAAAGKAGAKKPAADKAGAKKPAADKAEAKKAAPDKAGAKKAAADKAEAKKAPADGAEAKKAPAGEAEAKADVDEAPAREAAAKADADKVPAAQAETETKTEPETAKADGSTDEP